MIKKVKIKKILPVIVFLLFFAAYFNKASAYGECDQYGFMATYDSLSRTCRCMSGYGFGKDVLGQTTCISDADLCQDQYGYNATADYLTGNCKCKSGYGFSKDYSGQTECVSDDELCQDQYGYNATSDYLTDNCKCRYGYVFGKNYSGQTQCISGSEFCQDQYGYNAEYDSLNEKCACRRGYELTQKTTGGLECKSCSTKYGPHSSFSYSSKKCECDSGYTLDDSSQCVEKQNNVYFTLKELDTDNKKAIIQSDYDYKYYLITYNNGCYSASFRRYLNNKIVVNLGTDFSLDRWDKIVLQNDNETCDIINKEYADSSTTLVEEEEEPVNYFITETKTTPPAPVTKTPEVKKQVQPPVANKKPEPSKVDESKLKFTGENMVNDSTFVASGTTTEKAPEKNNDKGEIKKESIWKRFMKWLWS